jgi:hypothetical protein
MMITCEITALVEEVEDEVEVDEAEGVEEVDEDSDPRLGPVVVEALCVALCEFGPVLVVVVA